jgi:hypothetical protein
MAARLAPLLSSTRTLRQHRTAAWFGKRAASRVVAILNCRERRVQRRLFSPRKRGISVMQLVRVGVNIMVFLFAIGVFDVKHLYGSGCLITRRMRGNCHRCPDYEKYR